MYQKALTNKKILFLSPAFFSYEHIIKTKMEQMGASVVFYDERSVKSAFERALLKVTPAIFSRKSYKYFQNIINENIDNDFDYILIVKCDMVPKEIIKKFREAFPHAKLCLHIWDSIENIPKIEEKIPCFDLASSNDRIDCSKRSDLVFRPLFFSDAFCRENNEDQTYKYDISFCGTIHSDRYEILSKIKTQCEEKNLSFYVFPYLQSSFIYDFYKLTKKSFKGTSSTDFSFEKRSHEEIADIEDTSKAIIDIQHPAQSGLTMRTIEMVGMKKKLITTNADIVNYDLYDAANICVIDRMNPVIDNDFISRPYNELPKEIYRKYSLDQWIHDVLGIGGLVQ